jgi:hypothetical protein
MKLEIFSTKLTSQQHQHEDGNLQHEAGISTTSTRSWKSSARGWHHNNINTKLEIFSMRLDITTTSTRSWKSSARGWHHNTTPPFEGGPFGLHQACLESAQPLHETEAWLTHLQPVHPCQHIGALKLPSASYHE